MTKRTFDQYCPIARALEVVGERWSLLIVRELMLGPKRYTDLRRALPGMWTNLLADRLSELESVGVIARRELPAPAARTVYELTARGRDLEPVLLQLGTWGAPLLERRRSDQVPASTAVLVGLRAWFQAEAGLTGDLRAADRRGDVCRLGARRAGRDPFGSRRRPRRDACRPAGNAARRATRQGGSRAGGSERALDAPGRQGCRTAIPPCVRLDLTRPCRCERRHAGRQRRSPGQGQRAPLG